MCYGNDDCNLSSNPVFQAFEQQLNFCMARKKGTGRKTKNTSDDIYCKLYVCSLYAILLQNALRIYQIGSTYVSHLKVSAGDGELNLIVLIVGLKNNCRTTTLLIQHSTLLKSLCFTKSEF